MQNNEQSLLLTHRENYIVPKGQEQIVHCKIAKLDASGNFLEEVRLVRFGLKKFETMVKANLETMGYTVEILHHPMGKYSNSVIKSKDLEIKVKNAEIEALKAELESKDSTKDIAEKDAEIARLKAALAEAEKKGAEANSESKDSTKDESKGESEGEAKDNANPAEGTEEKKNKGGRPRKEA